MSHTGYIIDTAVLSSIPKGHNWHATQVPGDPTKMVLAIEWDNPNDIVPFEARAGVLPLGRPWETLPPAAASVLASFDPAPLGGPLGPVQVGPTTVNDALTKVAATWPLARLIR